MKILDCLKGAQGALVADMVRHVTEIIDSRISRGEGISFREVYNDLIREFEMDMESAAALYLKAAPGIQNKYDKIEGSLTSEEDITALLDGEINKLQQRAGPKKGSEQTIKGQKEAGGRYIAKAIVKLIDNKLFPTNRTMSVANKFREGVIKYAKDHLDKKSVVGRTPEAILTDLINQALLEPGKNTFNVLGQEELWESLKPALDEVIGGIKDDALREQFKNEVAKIKEAAFNMGVTETNRKKILDDLIVKHTETVDGKETRPYAKQIGKKALEIEMKAKILENPKDAEKIEQEYKEKEKELRWVPDWNAIAKSGDIVGVLGKVLDAELTKRGVSPETKAKIYDALVAHYSNLARAATYSLPLMKAIDKDAKLKSQLIDEVAISNGFYKMRGSRRVAEYDLKGTTNKPRVGWLRAVLIQEGRKDLADKLGAQSTPKEVRDAITLVVNKWIENKNMDQLSEAVRRLMELNNTKFKDKVRKIDQLSRLQNMGVGLDPITDAIAASILGLRIKPEYIAELNAILELHRDLIRPPKDIYDDIGIDPALRARLPQTHSMSYFSRNANEEINRRIGELLAKAARNDEWRSVNGVIQAMGKFWRMMLTGILMNPYNAAQNLFHAQYAMFTSIPKDGWKKFLQDEKTFGKILWSVAMGDPTGLTDDELRRTEDLTTFYHGKKGWEKFALGVKAFAEGFLTGVDAAGMIIYQRHRMYDAIEREARLKGDYDAIMKEYKDLIASNVARDIAQKYLESVGITKGSRPVAYNRILMRETYNVELGFFMGSGMNHILNPDRVLGYNRTLEKTARTVFGKDDPKIKHKDGGGKWTTKYGGIPNFPAMMVHAVSSWEKMIADKQLKENTVAWKVAHLFATLVRGMVTTTIMPFAGGAFRFFNFSVFALAAPITIPVAAGVMKHEMRALKKFISTADRDARPVNEESVQNALYNYEIARMYLNSSISALLASAAVFGIIFAAMGDDDDDEDTIQEKIEKATDMVYEFTKDNPVLKALISRVAPVHIRFMFGWAEGLHRNQRDIKNKPSARALNYAASMRTPLTPLDFLEMFYDKKGEFQGELVAGQMLGGLFGAGNILWPVSWANAYGDYLRGERKKISPDVSPLLRETPFEGNKFFNSIVNKVTGTPIQYAMQGTVASKVDNLLLLRNIPNGKSLEQVRKDIYGKKFKDIRWDRYDKDLDARKEQIHGAVMNLRKVRKELDRVYTQLHNKWDYRPHEFNVDDRWDYPDAGFYIQPTEAQLRSMESYFDIKRTDGGRINLLAVVKQRLEKRDDSFRKLDLNLDDIINARKFQIDQEQLKK